MMRVKKSKPGITHQVIQICLMAVCAGLPLWAAAYGRPHMIQAEEGRIHRSLAAAFRSVFGDFDNQPWKEPVWSQGMTFYKIKKNVPGTEEGQVAGYAALLTWAPESAVTLSAWNEDGQWIGAKSFKRLPALHADSIDEPAESSDFDSFFKKHPLTLESGREIR